MEFTYWSIPESPLSRYFFKLARSLLPMLPNMPVTIFDSPTVPPSASPFELPVCPASCESPLLEESPWAPMPMVMRLVMSKPWFSMESGYSESVSSSTLAM